MGLLVAEPRGLDSTVDVQGSDYLERKTAGHGGAEIELGLVKTAPGRPDLILVPCPSDDPADPLNWGRWKRESAFVTLCVCTILAGLVGPVLVPAFLLLVTDLNEPLNRIALVNGIYVLFVGVGCVLWAALAAKFGQRPTFLLAGIVSFVAHIWAAASNNLASLVAARAFQGLGGGCFFSNVPHAINDMFFTHQRGLRLALWNLSLIGGVNIGPIVTAQIISAQGWHFALWWLALAGGISVIATFLLVAESTYDRSHYDPGPTIDELQSKPSPADVPGKIEESQLEEELALPSSVQKDSSYWRSLKFCSAVRNATPFWRLALRPFFHITSIPVIFGAFVYSTCFNLLPLLGSTYAQIFGALPYSFSTSAIGLIAGLPALVGTLIGTFTIGPLSDWAARSLSSRNKGVFEPEFRLILMLVFAVAGGMGCYGWGLASAAGDSWAVVSVFIAILHIGISAATIASVGYVSECSAPGQAADAVGLVTFIKSCIGFGITFFANEWYATKGAREFFLALGHLVVVVSALSIPMYIFGKRARYWVQKHTPAFAEAYKQS